MTAGHRLKPHPDFPCAADIGIQVEAVRDVAQLHLRFRATGNIDALTFPAMAQPQRRDGLWKHTCFEAFIQPDEAHGYHEFNFAPSTEWAAYRFQAYREGMAAAELPVPRIETRKAPAEFLLDATLELAATGSLAAFSWQVGLSAVIEDRAGARSYWALRHPPGAPDFHHRDCFALRFDAPARP